MTTKPLPADNSWVTESPDRPRVPAEVVFLLVVLTLTVIFSIAGVPGEPDPVVSDGSDALRQDWLEQHNLTHAADDAVDIDATAEPVVPAQPTNR